MCDQAVWLHTLNAWDQNSIKYPLLPRISDIHLPNYPKFTRFYSSLANFDAKHGPSPALVTKFQLLFQCFLVAYGGIEVILSTPWNCILMYSGLKVKYSRVYIRGRGLDPQNDRGVMPENGKDPGFTEIFYSNDPLLQHFESKKHFYQWF